MLQTFSFLASAVLAFTGVSTAVVGIVTESFKAAAIGVVLIFAAGVFATLYLGTRWAARSPE